jgi:AcrR family transcriptional regulator
MSRRGQDGRAMMRNAMPQKPPQTRVKPKKKKTIAKPRSTYHHNDLPDALLNAAESLVAKNGPNGFSLREAARMVGVDPAASYRHFKDREAILQAIARRGFTRLRTFMVDAVTRAGGSEKAKPTEAIMELGRAYVAFALENHARFRTMFGGTGVDARSPILRGDYAEGDGPYDTLVNALRRWSIANGLEETEPALNAAAITVWSAAHGISCLLIDGALPEFDSTAARDRAITNVIKASIAGLATTMTRKKKPKPESRS